MCRRGTRSSERSLERRDHVGRGVVEIIGEVDEPSELTETAFWALRLQLFEPSKGKFGDNVAQRSMFIEGFLTCYRLQPIIELQRRAHMPIIAARREVRPDHDPAVESEQSNQ